MVSARTPVEAAPQRPASPAHSGIMLAVLVSAMFMVQFDFFVVNVAAPSLRQDLHTGTGALQLVVGGYAFAYASGMVTGGRLGDMFGHRRLFAIGALLFGATSLLCGASGTAVELIVARLAQGLSGALMVPQVLAIITAHLPSERRPRAIGFYGLASGMGSIAGQVLGGAIVQANIAGLSWRMIFYVNVPIGIAAFILALRVLPHHESTHRVRLDPLGALGISSALALVLVALTVGQAAHWPAWIWACLGAAVPVAAATLYWERSLTRRDGDPILNVTLFTSPSFRAGMIAITAFMFFFGSFMFTLTLLLQSGLGLTPLEAGLVFLPQGVLFSATALVAGKLVARYGMNTLVAGSAITATGLVVISTGLAVWGAGAALPVIVGGGCCLGVGNGIVLPSLIRAALLRVQPRQAGVASGALTTAQQFAGSAGVVLLGVVFFALAGSHPVARTYSTAMAWTTGINVLLVLAVVWASLTFKRIAASTSTGS